MRDVTAPGEVVTERLVLVRPRAEDAADIFERYASDPEVTRFLGWPRHTSIRDTQAFLAFSASEWERWPAGPYLVRHRGDGQLLGGTGLGFETAERAMTGYVLAKDAWGRGYATEALVAMVEIARLTGIRRLYALCHPDHRASGRVLEKCGFALESDGAQPVTFPNLSTTAVQAHRYELMIEGRFRNEHSPTKSRATQ